MQLGTLVPELKYLISEKFFMSMTEFALQIDLPVDLYCITYTVDNATLYTLIGTHIKFTYQLSLNCGLDKYGNFRFE